MKGVARNPSRTNDTPSRPAECEAASVPRYLRREGLVAALLFAALLPLKLSVAYAPLIVLLLLRLCSGRRAWAVKLPRTLMPLAVLGLVFAIVSCYGVSPERSLLRVHSFLISLLLADTIYRLSCRYSPNLFLGALLGGQSIASLYSVAEAYFPGIPSLFLGPVSEAGQLAMTVVIALGLVVQSHRIGELSLRHLVGSVLLFGLALAIAVTPRDLALAVPLRALALTLGTLALFFVALRLVRRQQLSIPYVVAFVVCPLLNFALIANLKRGPWTGVACGVIILLLLHARRFLIPVTVLGFMVLLLPAVQYRLTNSASDFFIRGGRSDIWEIGRELVLRFPLGVGYENSKFLQQFSVAVPPELTHFHNNALNILVEGGWIALAVFAWWLLVLTKQGFNRTDPDYVYRTIIGAALVAWQVAGLVEYNIGDSEVFFVALTCIGILASYSGARTSCPHPSS